MSTRFKELDYRPTAIGAVSLRRRWEPVTGQQVYEIKLGEEHLMSSLFTASEIALARLALAACEAPALDVVVGGLGLGYTAYAALEDSRVRDMVVVEMLAPVIDWHRAGLVPMGAALAESPRCRLVAGDFFAMAAGDPAFDHQQPGRRFDAILLDIDHSPEALLDTRSSSFYAPAGLSNLARHLKPGGVFGLWSNDLPDSAFTQRLDAAIGPARAEPVTFFNPLQERDFTQTVYLATRP